MSFLINQNDISYASIVIFRTLIWVLNGHAFHRDIISLQLSMDFVCNLDVTKVSTLSSNHLMTHLIVIKITALNVFTT
jgi:hypothetical protein